MRREPGRAVEMSASPRLLVQQMPALVEELGRLLERAGRGDLVAQMKNLSIVRAEASGAEGRVSLYASDGPRAYAVEFETGYGLVVIDMAAQGGILAIHLLPPAD